MKDANQLAAEEQFLTLMLFVPILWPLLVILYIGGYGRG